MLGSAGHLPIVNSYLNTNGNTNGHKFCTAGGLHFYHAHPTPTYISPNWLILDFNGPVVLVLIIYACSLCCCWLHYCMQLDSTE